MSARCSISDDAFQQTNISPSVARVLVILHHVNQRRLGNVRLLVRFASVKVEVAESAALEVTDLAVVRSDLVVDVHDVSVEVPLEVEGSLALVALLSPLCVFPGHVALEVQPGRECGVTLRAGEGVAGVEPGVVLPQLRLSLETLAADHTEVARPGVLVHLLHVHVQSALALEEQAAQLAGESVDVGAVDLHHVVLQARVVGKLTATIRTDEGLQFDSSDDLLELRMFSFLRVKKFQVMR